MLAIGFLLNPKSKAIRQFLIIFDMGLKNTFAKKFRLIPMAPALKMSIGSREYIVFGVFGSTFLFVAVHLGMHICP